ncbi:MAG: GntR family transcriptional regulator [Spirochaetes bacterium]|nr:GntR family transcriptional regulator [Spirochaetota bacterium]
MKNAIDKSNPIPLYIQLGNWLEMMIKADSFKVGSMLPSENELATVVEVNRNTVRHAITLLIQKGLVEKKKGVGTFVKRKLPIYPVRKLNRMTSFVDDFEMDNVEIEDRILLKEKVPVTPDIAEKLFLTPQEFAVKIERLRIADKLPLVLEIQYYRFSSFGRLLEMDIKGSMYKILTTIFDVDLDHSVQTIRAVYPTEDIADKLHITPSIPCIFLESLAYTEEGLCIEVLHSFYRGDRYLFKVETGEYYRGIGTAEK